MAKDVEGNEKSYRVRLKSYATSDEGESLMPLRLAVLVIAADYFTVEPSGAATFWIRSEDRERSALIMAFGVGEWARIELAS